MFRGISIACLAAVSAAASYATSEETPRPAPPLKVTLTDGKDFYLSKLRGKVVALEFIYTTCPHCQQATQITDRLVRTYGQAGLRAVAVACNDGADLLAPDFVKEFQIGFPVGVGTQAMMFEFLGNARQPFRLPLLVIIDRKGMIRARYTGADSFFTDTAQNLLKAIEPLLKETAPTDPAPAKPAAKRR